MLSMTSDAVGSSSVPFSAAVDPHVDGIGRGISSVVNNLNVRALRESDGGETCYDRSPPRILLSHFLRRILVPFEFRST